MSWFCFLKKLYKGNHPYICYCVWLLPFYSMIMSCGVFLNIFLHVIWSFFRLDRSLVNKHNTVWVVSSLGTLIMLLWTSKYGSYPKLVSCESKIKRITFSHKALVYNNGTESQFWNSKLKFDWFIFFSISEIPKTVWVECSSCLDWELEPHVSRKCKCRRLKGTGRYWHKLP